MKDDYIVRWRGGKPPLVDSAEVIHLHRFLDPNFFMLFTRSSFKCQILNQCPIFEVNFGHYHAIKSPDSTFSSHPIIRM